MLIQSVRLEQLFGNYVVSVETIDGEIHDGEYRTEAEAAVVFNEMSELTDFSFFPEPCE